MTEENKEARDNPQENKGFADKTEKWWDATRKTLNQAGFKATQYKQIVQKKIDLASIHKKIDHAHSDLGKLVDEAHEVGEKDIFARDDIKRLLEKLDELKHSAATLEHEIAMTKVAEPQDEQHSEDAVKQSRDQRAEESEKISEEPVKKEEK